MKRITRRLKPAIVQLRALAESGVLERDLAEACARACDDLDHAIQSRDQKGVVKGVDAVAKLFLSAKK